MLSNMIKESFIILIGTLVFRSAYSMPIMKATNDLSKVNVVEMKDYSFTADSLLSTRKEIHYNEAPAASKYLVWANDAIDRVNQLVPKAYRLKTVKVKLIFSAIITSTGRRTQRVPISIIDSYQEPKTNSMRIGMAELKHDKLAFQFTVAHEYSHLVFENASRETGTTLRSSDEIKFWPKPVYEGVADLVASLAMGTTLNGRRSDWFTRNLTEFQTLKQAKLAKDTTIPKAKVAFREMGLIPKYAVYQDWLREVSTYIKAIGGNDPYAEGDWLAGSLLTSVRSQPNRQKLVAEIIERAKSGEPVSNIQSFRDDLIKHL